MEPTHLPPISRRALLGGAASSVGIVGLAGCSTIFPTPSNRGAISSANPFGVPVAATIEAQASLRFGGAPWDFAAGLVTKQFAGAKVMLSEMADLSTSLEPRFSTGTPPDLVVNSGAGAVPMGPLLQKLMDLTPMLQANNYDNVKLRDVLVDGVVEAGMANGALLGLNYVRVVHGLWFSTTRLAERGWQPPVTWDDLLTLGRSAIKSQIALLGWTPQDLSDIQTLVIDSAIKQGGHEVRLGLENLSATSWTHPAVHQVLTALDKLRQEGLVRPFENLTELRAAFMTGKVAMLPSGSWLEWQCGTSLPPRFDLDVAPAPVVTMNSALPPTALHAAAEEPVIIGRGAKDPWGGQELLRAMLSPASAIYLAKFRQALPVVRGIVPPDGYGSNGLRAQLRLIGNAGEDTFGWRFVTWYGLAAKQLPLWQKFLNGQLDVKGLTAGLQQISDEVRGDPSVTKVAVR